MDECNTNLVVHRDIKPANILLTADLKPKICDFGLSKRLRDCHELMETKVGLLMPPESQREGQYGMDIDLWSFGVMLYQAVTGHVPFEGKADSSPLKIQSCVRISPHCSDLIKRLLKKDSDNRIQFAEFFAHPFIHKDSETYKKYLHGELLYK